MTRLIAVGCATLVAIGWPHLDCSQASEFTDIAARAAEAALPKHFEGKPGGIVVGLIDAEGNKIICVGTLDDGTDRPIDGDSVFFIGSVTKTFTTLLLAEMAGRGEVQLDDPVANCLPDSVRVPTHGGKEITLMHLATNTAGCPFNASNMTGSDDHEQYVTYDVRKMYDFVSGFELTRDPGTVYAYSNLGMSLLGHALERRAGTSYEELVVDRICRPLGMDSTRVVPDSKMNKRLALGRDEQGRSVPPWRLDAYAPAGAIHSTAGDLLKFAAAQAGITRPALTPAMELTQEIRYQHEGTPGDPQRLVFGRTAMAWTDRDAYQPPGMELLAHAGGAGSHHAWVGFDKKQRRGVVVLTTANYLSAEAIGWTLLQRLPVTEERLHVFAQNLVGIGAALELTADTHEPRITRVLPATPAEEAGLTAGLVIQSIDEAPTRGKELPACLDLIRGPAGSQVRLVVFDPAKQETRTVEVTRRKFRT